MAAPAAARRAPGPVLMQPGPVGVAAVLADPIGVPALLTLPDQRARSVWEWAGGPGKPVARPV